MRLLCLTLLALLALPLPAALGSDGDPPLVVALEGADGRVAVSWSPGDAPADAYRVYGASAAGLVLLGEVAPGDDAPLFLAPGGHAGYAVAAVQDGAEGTPVDALFVRTGCWSAFLDLYLFDWPPGFVIDWSCSPVSPPDEVKELP